MTLQKITVQNFRSYDLFSAELSPRTTLLLGANGSGKTSLLEAVYYTSLGTSFRGRARDLINHDANRADIKLVFDEDRERRASITQAPDDSIKRTFTQANKTVQRLTGTNRWPVVLFEPDELRLISSSPERRRKFLDGIVSRLYPQYAALLGRYQRTLLQRNELLKRREQINEADWDNHLFTWDIKYAELAEQIVTMRRDFIVTSNNRLGEHYSKMADDNHIIKTIYQSSISADPYKQALLTKLHANRIADSYRGYTGVGPHRDDFSIYLDGYPAAETASRGEMRTIMLAYKLLEIELQTEIYDKSPLILMDDVFSELDTAREQKLMEQLLPYQTIITATDLRDELKVDATIIKL